MKRRRILLTCWLVIQLLVGQQLALAHLIGHLGQIVHAHTTAEPSADDGDEERGAEHTLSHVCTTCVSCLGFDALPAGDAATAFAAVAWVCGSFVAVPPAPTFDRPAPFQSRAPPLLQG